MEHCKKLVLNLGSEVLRSEAPCHSDNCSHLIEVLRTVLTAAQVGIEATAIARRQGIFEVVRD